MKSMFIAEDVSPLLERFDKLRETSKSKWGKFSVQQMLCHLIDQMEFALGENPESPLAPGPPLLIRHAVRLYLPWPKGAPTDKSMLKTQPKDMSLELRRVLELLQKLEQTQKSSWAFHPFFGKLNGEAWAKLTWRHNHYHLKQFGV